MAIPQNIAILPRWEAIADSAEQQERATLLSARLKRDLPDQHPLSGYDLKAVAARIDCDDVLFEVIGGEQPLAVVRRKETYTRWPQTKLFKNWQQWAEETMLTDNQSFTAGE